MTSSHTSWRLLVSLHVHFPCPLHSTWWYAAYYPSFTFTTATEQNADLEDLVDDFATFFVAGTYTCLYIYIYTLRNCYSIYNLWLVITLFRSGDYCHVVNLHCDFVAPKPWSTAEVVVLYHDKQITCEACGTNSWFSVLCAQAEELFIILKTTLSLILQSFGGSLRGVRWEAVSDCWGPGEDGVPGTGSASVCVPSRSAALILNAHTRKAKGNVKEWRSLEAAELQPRYEGLRTTVG